MPALRPEAVIEWISANRFSGVATHLCSNRGIFTYVGSFISDLVRLVMTATPYVAGPDVFLTNEAAHAEKKGR